MENSLYAQKRICFLQYFAMLLLIAVGAFFGIANGLPADIWSQDASHITSVIAILFVLALTYNGYLSYNLNEANAFAAKRQAHWIDTLAFISPLVGIIGTAAGLRLQAPVLLSGVMGMGPIATALYSTMVGACSGAILALININLKISIARLRNAEVE